MSGLWSENTALFKRLKIHSNPPILYYGFNVLFILILRRFEVVIDVWSENAEQFIQKINSYPPIAYYGLTFVFILYWKAVGCFTHPS